MEWPWVSRSYLNLNKAFDNERVEKAYELVTRLETELEYYRTRYEAEKERADRAVDALVQWCGREPISTGAIEATQKQSLLDEQMRKQALEIFGDVATSVLGEEEETDDLKNIPLDKPEVVVRTIEARLAALRSLPRYNPKDKSDNNSVADVTLPS